MSQYKWTESHSESTYNNSGHKIDMLCTIQLHICCNFTKYLHIPQHFVPKSLQFYGLQLTVKHLIIMRARSIENSQFYQTKANLASLIIICHWMQYVTTTQTPNAEATLLCKKVNKCFLSLLHQNS